MVLVQFRKTLLALSLLWTLGVLALGAWWLYLIVKLGNELNQLGRAAPQAHAMVNFISLAKWEGATFLIFLMLISGTILFMYFRDLKRSRALSSFFASLTHELKTPLASIRLQSEVIHEKLHDRLPAQEQADLHQLFDRMIEDTQYLEMELDKILQLSRVEQGGALNLIRIDLPSFLKKLGEDFFSQNHFAELQLKYASEEDFCILADEFALRLIFRNLFENTLRHNRLANKKILISLEKDEKGAITLNYCDFGGPFSGNLQSLGKLFYKHQSSKGSGIGLYLAKKLMFKMKGHLDFLLGPEQALEFQLRFPLLTEGGA